MNRVLAGAITATAIATLAGAAKAEKSVCVWTGVDWACGDGNTFPQHYPASIGPNMVITPVPTVMPPNDNGQRLQ
jgi:hypothetical protein